MTMRIVAVIVMTVLVVRVAADGLVAAGVLVHAGFIDGVGVVTRSHGPSIAHQPG